jgi:hypothetical protein
VRWARRTATIIAVATGLVPQLPAWHPPLTVAPPVLHRLPPPRSCSCRTDATSSAAGALEVVVSGRRVTVGHARLQLRGGRLSPFCRRWRQHLRGRRHHRHCTPRAATSTVQITSRYGAQRKRRVLRSSCSPSPRCCSSTNRPRGSTRGWTARSCTPCGSWPTTTARRGHNAQRGRGGLNRSWQQLDREGGGGVGAPGLPKLAIDAVKALAPSCVRRPSVATAWPALGTHRERHTAGLCAAGCANDPEASVFVDRLGEHATGAAGSRPGTGIPRCGRVRWTVPHPAPTPGT